MCDLDRGISALQGEDSRVLGLDGGENLAEQGEGGRVNLV